MDPILLSLVAFLLVVAVVAVLAAAAKPFVRLATRFVLERKRLAVLTVLALLVASSMITGALAVGDSMRAGVVESVYGNLGGVDEVVSAGGLFRESILDALSGDASLADLADAMAPLLLLKGSVRDRATDLLEAKANLVGYDPRFLALGGFEVAEGTIGDGVPGSGEAFLNERLAGAIGAKVGDTLRIATGSPGFSIESIFSLTAGQSTANVSVVAIVKDVGLGRFSLEGRSAVAENLFLDLGYLQGVLGVPGEINTIVVSNRGDARSGIGLTGAVTARLHAALDEAIAFPDLRFRVDALGYVRVENDDVFFDGRYLDFADSLVGQVPGVEAVSALTSYFVNNLSFQGRSVAYSTVTGLDPAADAAFGLFTLNGSGAPVVGDIGDDEIILTNYTAVRLGAGVGDAVTLNYTVYDRTHAPVYRTADFTVRHVVDIAGKADDPDLMPPFPGIRGKASCGDWDPPWINGDVMRSEMDPEDLDYWLAYGGTPKAYVTLPKARSLWSNDLGNLTTIKVKAGDPAAAAPETASRLNATVTAGDAGLQVLAVKASGLESAEGVQLLTETFLAFGAVVIASGILLVVALVGMIVEGRRSEIAVLKTIGTRRSQITRTFAFEGFLLSLVASALGLLAGLGIASACIALTNAFWRNIVEGTTVSLQVTAETLVVGYIAGFLVAFLAFALAAHMASRSLPARLARDAGGGEPGRHRGVPTLASAAAGSLVLAAYFLAPFGEPLRSLAGLAGPVVLLLSTPLLLRGRGRDLAVRVGALAAIAYTFAYDLTVASRSESTPFLLFFASGFAIVLAGVVGLWASMRPLAAGLSRACDALGPRLSVFRISFLSPSRGARKTCLAVSLFAVVLFTYLGLSVNIQGQQLGLEDAVLHQGAGFDVYAESSVPLRFDLGNETARAKDGVTGFPPGTDVVQFLSVGPKGGTCSNLRRNLPPRILAANGTFVRESLLRFQSPGNANASAWSWLDAARPDGAIPAIGDYNTVVWILGKGVGDRIPVVDERGVERELVVMAVTENSIFPGSVFVSEDNLDALYPTTAEYAVFLFRTDDGPGLVPYLESALERYGMDAVAVERLVADNLSVEWSYMGLFQALLLLGLFVGTLGLAATASRAVEERRTEIGTVRALGFGRRTVLATLIVENLYVAALGAAIGAVAGVVTGYAFFGEGSLLGYRGAVPWAAMVAVIGAVSGVAVLATIGPARRAARMSPVDALRRE